MKKKIHIDTNDRYNLPTIKTFTRTQTVAAASAALENQGCPKAAQQYYCQVPLSQGNSSNLEKWRLKFSMVTAALSITLSIIPDNKHLVHSWYVDI